MSNETPDLPNLFGDQQEGIEWDDKNWGIARAKASFLFNPSKPINEQRLFAGRIAEVGDLLDVVYEGGAHAIIYGERGVGKSSLANTIRERIPAEIPNIKIIKDNCRPEDTFFTLWSKMLFEFEYDRTPVSDFLQDETRHFIVPKILETFDPIKQHVFIFDEFDRISSLETKSALADTIKYFSDYPQNITIVVVGVGFSIEELFGAHPSIERCCRQILIPRMSKIELVEIIDDRMKDIEIEMSVSIKNQIVEISQGLPGYVHLLAREATISAIDRQSRLVENIDYQIAINKSVDRAQESIVSTYNKAIYSAKENIYKEVLLACSMAITDDRGKFSASDVREPLSKILGRSVGIGNFARHLAAFCDPDRGQVLRKTGKPKRFQYQFINAPLQPYIIMTGKRDGLI